MSDSEPGPPDGLPSRIFLVGLMGAGKSTVGTVLARSLLYPYLDNDSLLEKRAGADAASLAEAGRDVLHRHESGQLRAVLGHTPPYVAGIAASVADSPADLAAIAAAGRVVYLRAQPETLADRVRDGAGRPWLGADPLPVLRAMFTARDPILREIDIVIDTEGHEPAAIATAVAAYLRMA